MLLYYSNKIVIWKRRSKYNFFFENVYSVIVWIILEKVFHD